MNWKLAFFSLLIVFTIVNCSKSTLVMAPDRARSMQPNDISNFHTEISVKLGWVPYQDQQLVQTEKREWKVVKNPANASSGKVPVLYVQSPGADPILLDMNIKNEILGKLIKHSAITQEPIRRPFVDFFEEAKCQKCHPEDIEVDFER